MNPIRIHVRAYVTRHPLHQATRVYGADEGNRTPVPSLEGWCTNRCTTSANWYEGRDSNSQLQSPKLCRLPLTYPRV